MRSQKLLLLATFCAASSAGRPGTSDSSSFPSMFYSLISRSPLSKLTRITSQNDGFYHRRRRRRGSWYSSSRDEGGIILAKRSDEFSEPFKINASNENEDYFGNGGRLGSNKSVKSIEVYPFIFWKGLSSHLRRVAGRLPRLWSRVTADPNQFFDRLTAGAKFAIFAVIGIEIFLVVRDIFNEAMSDYRDSVSDEATSFRGLIYGNNCPVLSAANVKKLLLWLQEPNKEARSPPPNDVSPAWVIPLAEDLRECKALSLSDIQQILLRLTKAEALMLQSCLLSSESRVDFQDIGGLALVKETIAKWLVSALSTSNDTKPALLGSHELNQGANPFQKIVSNKNGLRSICLWGPPGCGKSLLIRAIAKHSGLPTLVITPSMLQRKWYGESTERVRSLFKLVNSLGSCVVVMDEMDGLLMSRRDEDHEVTRELKTEWLQWWDGLAAETFSSPSSSFDRKANHNRVLFVAATNRPWDVDAAAWRRLGHRVYVGLPNSDDRLNLMEKWLKGLPHVPPQVLHFAAQATEGYPPSDIHNLLVWACQNGPIARKDTNLEIEDIFKALQEVVPTQFSPQYVSQLRCFRSSHRQGTLADASFSSESDPLSLNPQNDANNPLFAHSTANASPNEDGIMWQTPMGNFYQLQVPVDSSVFEAIQSFLRKDISDEEEYSWSDWEDFKDFDDDSDSDDYPV